MQDHILSIDLESWVHFQEDLRGDGRRRGGPERAAADEGYLPRATGRILDLLERHGRHATFFVLGEVGDWYPDLADRILARGHEVGYHTHSHPPRLPRGVLAAELERSRAFLERHRPRGFRAPRVAIDEAALDLLGAWGFEYSSSTYAPYRRRRSVRGLEEIPVSSREWRGRARGPVGLPRPLSFRLLAREIPFGSGLFVSLLGKRTSRFIRDLEREGDPAVLFLHPWQICRPPAGVGRALFADCLRRNPLALPYLIGVEQAFEGLLQAHRFTSFERYRRAPVGPVVENAAHRV